MADRTSAEVFGVVFGILANEMAETPDRDRIVRQIWHLSKNYDFSPYQMEADDVLSSLGLLRRLPNVEHPDEGDLYEYGPASPNGGDPQCR